MEEEEKKEPEHEHSNKKSITEKIRENPWVLSTFVCAALVIILLIATFSGGITGNVSKEKAADNLVNYAKLQGVDVSVNKVSEDSGLYNLNVDIDGQATSIYMTKDGRNIVNGLIPVLSQSSSNTQTQTETIPKSDKPSVELYVMSFCPYGNQAEKTMQPVYNLLKDKVDWNVHFIVSVSGNVVNSLHGSGEVTEDEREACVIKNYGIGTWFTFANYVNDNCGSDGSCWQDAAKEANVNINTINSCVSSDGLDLMKTDEAASEAAGANGSPTLVINGVQSNTVYQYGDSELYKGTICEAFNDVPSECTTQLTSTSSSTPSGSCS